MPEGTTAPEFGDLRLPQRFWDKVRVDPGGCWRWVAATSIGYGKFRWKGRSAHAHLVAYRVLIGPIPVGLVADHECHVPSQCPGGDSCVHRRCVNPAHIGLKPSAENTSRGRVSHWNSRKTRCRRGHEYTPGNTRIAADGKRYCQSCERERSAGRYIAYRSTHPIHEVTHCPQGHAYTDENTRVSAGKRQCRTCDREQARAKRAALRADNPLEAPKRCRNGHEYTPENTGRKPNGARVCKTCSRAAKQAWRDRQRS